MNQNDIILTGDRPTGKLHIGHYAGSLERRILMQQEYANMYVMIADWQALTDHFDNPSLVRQCVLEVAADYLACGLDPKQVVIFIQSLVPELCELTMLYQNFVTLARLKRNPTVKTEMNLRGFGDAVPIGFLGYPVSQTADITAFKATLIPVGDDQLPMIEQCNEIVRRVNNQVGRDILVECKSVLSKVSRLPGTDGDAKMSKSVGNCIYIGDDEATVKQKVMGMFTDPNHLKVSDPGNDQINPVFKYLEAFDPNKGEVEELRLHYRRGGLGDVVLKKRLIGVLEDRFAPIRAKRQELIANPDYLTQVLLEGSKRARAVASQTLAELKDAFYLSY